MVKKRSKIFPIIIISLVIIALFTIFYLSISQTIFTTEVGWIPYEGATDSFTNPNLNVMTYNAIYLWSRFTSKYWTIEEKDLWNGVHPNDYNYRGYFANPITTGFTSGELDMYLTENGGGTMRYVKFNENLAGKNFRINYNAIDGEALLTQYSSEYYSGKGLIEFKPSALEEKSFIYINGNLIKEVDTSSGELYFEVGEPNNPHSANGFFSGILRLYNPRYKDLFSCNVDNDEVVVADTFASGTKFDISDTTYPIRKFCVEDYPAVVRSFTERGSTAISSEEILQRLSDGDEITIDSDKTITIQYITKDQTGIQRCASGEAWDVEKDECVNVLSEGEPDVEPGVEEEIIIIGSGEFSDVQDYQNNKFIVGDLVISSTQPKYVCSCPVNDGYVSPSSQVDDDCWKTTINGKEVSHKSNVDVDEYVNVEYLFSGRVYCGERDGITYDGGFVHEEDWKNNLIININPDGLAITPEENIGIVPLNEDYEISFFTENNIASFDSDESGFRVITNQNIIDQITEENILKSISKGNNQYKINLDTSKLGDVEAKVTPYVVVEDGRKVYGSKTLVINYKVEENPTQEDIDSSKQEPVVEETKIPILNLVLFIVGGLVVLTLLILIIRKLIKK